jgi:hypothetical protein
MNKYHRKIKRLEKNKYKKKTSSFWKAVSRYGFGDTWKYEMKHPRRYPRYPLWFIPILISMVIISVIQFFFNIEYLPLAFYVLEIVAVSYLLIRLVKRFDRIKINGSYLRLFGLRILSGLISAFGIILLFFTYFTYTFSMLETMVNQTSFFSQIITFGYEWNTPYIVPLLLEMIGLGLCIIGAYLLFKFKMKSGNVIWVGRI